MAKYPCCYPPVFTLSSALLKSSPKSPLKGSFTVSSRVPLQSIFMSARDFLHLQFLGGRPLIRLISKLLPMHLFSLLHQQSKWLTGCWCFQVCLFFMYNNNENNLPLSRPVWSGAVQSSLPSTSCCTRVPQPCTSHYTKLCWGGGSNILGDPASPALRWNQPIIQCVSHIRVRREL